MNADMNSNHCLLDQTLLNIFLNVLVFIYLISSSLWHECFPIFILGGTLLYSIKLINNAQVQAFQLYQGFIIFPERERTCKQEN